MIMIPIGTVKPKPIVRRSVHEFIIHCRLWVESVWKKMLLPQGVSTPIRNPLRFVKTYAFLSNTSESKCSYSSTLVPLHACHNVEKLTEDWDPLQLCQKPNPRGIVHWKAALEIKRRKSPPKPLIPLVRQYSSLVLSSCKFFFYTSIYILVLRWIAKIGSSSTARCDSHLQKQVSYKLPNLKFQMYYPQLNL